MDKYKKAQEHFEERNLEKADNQCIQACNLIQKRRLGSAKYEHIFKLQNMIHSYD